MRTYEYPLGVTFRASTPEHAAARVFGGKPADYHTVRRLFGEGFQGAPTYYYIVVREAATGEWLADIPEAL